MKFKKLASIALVSIPLYFFTANTAKADEFKLNLKDPTVKIGDSEEEKGNVFNDGNFENFNYRIYDRMDRRIKEVYWNFEISQDLARFIEDPEKAVEGMNDLRRERYLEDVNDELEGILKREARKQAQEEFKESEFYRDFKEKVRYYRRRVTSPFRKKEVEEKEAYINEEGGVTFEYRKKGYKEGEDTEKKLEEKEIVIEEIDLDKEGDKPKFHFKTHRIGIQMGREDLFEFKLKTKPISIHSWDYQPRIDAYLVTKYFSLNTGAEYRLRKERLKTHIIGSLPKGYYISFSSEHRFDDDIDAYSASLQKVMNGYTLSLSYSETRYPDAYGDHLKSGIIMFSIEKKF